MWEGSLPPCATTNWCHYCWRNWQPHLRWMTVPQQSGNTLPSTLTHAGTPSFFIRVAWQSLHVRDLDVSPHSLSVSLSFLYFFSHISLSLSLNQSPFVASFSPCPFSLSFASCHWAHLPLADVNYSTELQTGTQLGSASRTGPRW